MSDGVHVYQFVTKHGSHNQASHAGGKGGAAAGGGGPEEVGDVNASQAVVDGYTADFKAESDKSGLYATELVSGRDGAKQVTGAKNKGEAQAVYTDHLKEAKRVNAKGNYYGMEEAIAMGVKNGASKAFEARFGEKPKF